MEDMLARYPRRQACSSPLDPLEDCAAWIRGLRSKGHAEDLLRTKHGQTSAAIIRDAARAIAQHAETASDLIEQALAGRSTVSYLPLYYAMLNLAKMAVIFSGRLAALHKQRHHGATWSGLRSQSHGLLTDHITLLAEGALPLFYETITGQHWAATVGHQWPAPGTAKPKRKIELRDVYRCIPCVGFEFVQAFGESDDLIELERLRLLENPPGGWTLHLSIAAPHAGSLRRYPFLRALSRRKSEFSSPTVTATDAAAAHAALARHAGVPWHLLYDGQVHGRPYWMTPKVIKRIAFPSEFEVLLAFFHLGNVVRYDPERLARLMDSKACSTIEVLRRHGALHFLLYAWSYYTQSLVTLVGV